jgi:MFS family permease
MYTVAVVWWSVFTAATALARDFSALHVVRLLLGLGEAGAYPSNAKVVSEWFPMRERAFATSIFDNGARFGTALSLPIRHVASIGGIQNFASNLAGVITAFFTGLVVQITGNYVVAQVTAGVLALVGAFSYLFIVGPIEPLPELGGARTEVRTA